MVNITSLTSAPSAKRGMADHLLCHLPSIASLGPIGGSFHSAGLSLKCQAIDSANTVLTVRFA